MIDTIKIAIFKDFNRTVYDTLLSNSEQKKNGFIINNSSGLLETSEIWRVQKRQYENYEQLIINGKMYCPTSMYHIHYRAFDDRIELEFSIPKFIYGTNTLELNSHITRVRPSPYDMMMLSLKKFFEYFFFGHSINYGGIQLMRWDFCYNQIFDSKETALKALEYIKIKYQKKKDTKNYTTGFVELTKSKYQKIYHKGTEFEINDAPKLKKYVNNFQNLANKTLRYERKQTPKNISYWYIVLFSYFQCH
jgi:hypothetical protein